MQKELKTPGAHHALKCLPHSTGPGAAGEGTAVPSAGRPEPQGVTQEALLGRTAEPSEAVLTWRCGGRGVPDSGFVHSGPKAEASRPSPDGGTGKRSAAVSAALFRAKRNGIPGPTWVSLDDVLFYSDEGHRVQCTGAEGRRAVTRDWGRGRARLMGTGVQLRGMEGSGDGRW